MEFIDPIVEETNTKEASENSQNQKTEEVVHKLEDEINNAYDLVETRFSSLWSKAQQNAHTLQEQVKFEERKTELMDQLNKARANIGNNEKIQENVKAIETQLKELGDHMKGLETKMNLNQFSQQANNALDNLDSKLEQVEKQAGKYMSQFTSFFSNMVTIEGASVEEDTKPSETIFSSENYGSSRYETDLYKLHTTESVYVDSDDSDADFNADDKTTEITQLLEKYPDTLAKLMNELVPVKVSYNLFWYRYFKAEQELKNSEEKRKELLKKKSAGDNNDDEEEFTWDDEDEAEEEAVDVGADKKSEAGDSDWE